MTRLPRVLCIEDDPATLDLLVEVLEDEGFETIVATDGVEGIRQLSHHPDLILCDIDMPHLTGFDVLGAFRKDAGQLRNVPFLFITAYGNRESHLQARRMGCDDFIAKPLDFELLVEIIRSRLAQHPNQEHVDFSLTGREIEALTWVAKGKSSTDIAVLMNVSERTVNFHVNNVIRKLGVATRVQAAIRCALLGLIET
ncbi:response regulator transcription factor [Bradyrhizobium sp. CCBAU 051011]|uniref:response regulator transcription factor n=1 Tax=Bradyrhizobium sp. CCBAU 051011 TaxID=858422 RepID=UPI001FEEAD8A|nr:response regulator transcription factor [Bradyrhizobium sp. CCBAU 051011]